MSQVETFSHCLAGEECIKWLNTLLPLDLHIVIVSMSTGSTLHSKQIFVVSTFERLDARQRLLLCWTFQRRFSLLKLTWRQVRGHNLTLGDSHEDSLDRFLYGSACDVQNGNRESAIHYDEHFDKVFLFSVYPNTHVLLLTMNKQQEMPLFDFVVVWKMCTTAF